MLLLSGVTSPSTCVHSKLKSTLPVAGMILPSTFTVSHLLNIQRLDATAMKGPWARGHHHDEIYPDQLTTCHTTQAVPTQVELKLPKGQHQCMCLKSNSNTLAVHNKTNPNANNSLTLAMTYNHQRQQRYSPCTVPTSAPAAQKSLPTVELTGGCSAGERSVTGASGVRGSTSEESTGRASVGACTWRILLFLSLFKTYWMSQA